MQLEVLLPFGVFAVVTDVSRVVADTPTGSFGLLEHRQDCVAALVPGLLVYETALEGEVCLAVDAGVLVKQGAAVRVCVRRALRSRDLGALRDAIRQQFLKEDALAASVRGAMAQLESGFLHRFAELDRE